MPWTMLQAIPLLMIKVLAVPAVAAVEPKKERTPISLHKVAQMVKPKIFGQLESAMSNTLG